MKIDLSFANAAVVLPREYETLRIFIIGAGGTGSYAAMAIARLCFELERTGKYCELIIIDPDRVEAVNIPRSNFCYAEIGRFKAQTLAERITLAWGLNVAYINEALDYEKHIDRSSFNELTIIVGCVDNHLARVEIHRTLSESNRFSETPRCWWIDGGNGKFSGQVLIGSVTGQVSIEDLFPTKSICQSLPAPSVIHADLLKEDNDDSLDDAQQQRHLSCPELVRRNDQSLNINERVAVEIAVMLAEFLLYNSLRRFACYFDLLSGTTRSLYSTPEMIERLFLENTELVGKYRT